MAKLDLGAEVSPKKTFVWAIDWPGWCRSGKDRDLAIEAFLADIVAMWRPGRSRVDRMHEEEVHRIWRDDLGLLTPAGVAGSDDPVLAGFAATLPAASRRRSRRRHGSPIFAGHDSQTVSPGGASARGPRSGAPAGNVSGRSSRRSGSPDCCDASSEPEP